MLVWVKPTGETLSKPLLRRRFVPRLIYALSPPLFLFQFPVSSLTRRRTQCLPAFRFNFIGGYPQCYPLLLFANLNLELETVYEILAHLFPSLQSYRVGNLVEAYLAFEKFANAFVQEFRNWESAWALEALYVVSYEIRILAEKADKELTSNGKSPEKLKAAGSLLMKVFGVLAGKGPKRVVALYVTCQLFKTCFKLGTVNRSVYLFSHTLSGSDCRHEDSS
ncbi:hypothetical protein F2Q69_00005308 [Brassica cretica]|uniref:Uncharacterized protein n=1 Tax=Brassica cretica TaxID=69181 RepID=A0A8S9P3T1_BRACR|nr:hypothetical protein F2Q69_00005308 [Brassica cretica]